MNDIENSVRAVRRARAEYDSALLIDLKLAQRGAIIGICMIIFQACVIVATLFQVGG